MAEDKELGRLSIRETLARDEVVSVKHDSDQMLSGPTAEEDPNIVDWDGPDDSSNPMNWSQKKKWLNMATISAVSFLTPFASSLPAPVTGLVAAELDFQPNSTSTSLIISIYVLGFAIGPLFLAPLSEIYGRLPLYHACNILFAIFTIVCAVAPNLAILLIFRFLAGTAGSCPLTIGGGTIADIFPIQNRGMAVSVWILGPLIGPSIGPVAGGYLGEVAGWRWCFWLITLISAPLVVMAAVILRESFEPVLLEHKAKLLRKQTGNQNLRSKRYQPLTLAQNFVRAIVRPTKMLLMSPIVFSLSIYHAVNFGYLYLMYVTFDQVFSGAYGFGYGVVGLVYLSNGVGALIGNLFFGRFSDKIVDKLSNGEERKAEYRLPVVLPSSFLIPIGLLWYGWSAQMHSHWIVPIIGTALIGMGNMVSMMAIQTYLIDAFSEYAASAIAACTVLRSLAGAFLPLAGPPIYKSLGYGWANTILAGIALILSPIGWICFKYGERIRTRWPVSL